MGKINRLNKHQARRLDDWVVLYCKLKGNYAVWQKGPTGRVLDDSRAMKWLNDNLSIVGDKVTKHNVTHARTSMVGKLREKGLPRPEPSIIPLNKVAPEPAPLVLSNLLSIM